jgi:hypothetical protein
MTRREQTIKYVLPNLLSRWPELSKYPPDAVAELYEDFSMSDDYGNNDEKFPEWFDMLNTAHSQS